MTSRWKGKKWTLHWSSINKNGQVNVSIGFPPGICFLSRRKNKQHVLPHSFNIWNIYFLSVELLNKSADVCVCVCCFFYVYSAVLLSKVPLQTQLFPQPRPSVFNAKWPVSCVALEVHGDRGLAGAGEERAAKQSDDAGGTKQAAGAEDQELRRPE